MKIIQEETIGGIAYEENIKEESESFITGFDRSAYQCNHRKLS